MFCEYNVSAINSSLARDQKNVYNLRLKSFDLTSDRIRIRPPVAVTLKKWGMMDRLC